MQKQPDERSALREDEYRRDQENNSTAVKRSNTSVNLEHCWPAWLAFLFLLSVFLALALYFLGAFSSCLSAFPVAVKSSTPSTEKVDDKDSRPYVLPSDFIWGAATSSYQIEGAVKEDGRGPSIWDAFCKQNGTVMDGSDGSVACDHYHRVSEDVAIMKSLNLKAYRFSISWSRIIPDGTGAVNAKGVAFYNYLIDTLLENGIVPWVTLFHWDLPETLYTNYGGWMDRDHTVAAFGDYARVCFEAYGDRVKRWITVNEAWTVAVNGHGVGVHAPGHYSDTEPYIVGHNLLLAHATAANIYKTEYATRQNGLIGISNSGDFRYPRTEQEQDYDAAERAMLFQMGWFTDPLFFGAYPAVMQDRLGSRLPQWTKEDQDLIRGSADFVGLNYYSSLQASTPVHEASWKGFWADVFVDFHSHPVWRKNYMGWSDVPDGLREMLYWLSTRYNHPDIFITENGSAEPEPNVTIAKNDEKRREFFEGHIRACAQALENDVNVKGYFAWSLMDNFEWQFGYQRRFGLFRVDFDTLDRIPKSSAMWYSRTIANHGRNVPRKAEIDWYPNP